MDDDRSRSFQSEATRLADAARDRASGAIEDVKVASGHVVDKVRDLIEEGNVRRISLRKGDRVLFEIPLTIGVGAGAAALLTSPLLAAVGAVAALVSDITISVERDDEAADTAASTLAAGVADTAHEHVANVNPGDSDAASGDAPSAKTVGKPTGDAA